MLEKKGRVGHLEMTMIRWEVKRRTVLLPALVRTRSLLQMKTYDSLEMRTM